MAVLFALFLAGIVGMLVVPLRHLGEIRVTVAGEHVPDAASENAVVRPYVIGYLDRVEQWYRVRAKEYFLKFLDRILRSFERFAGKIAGETKEVRLLIQERFRVIPRESLYWKQIHSWKRTSAVSRSHILGDSDPHGKDISNHAL